MKKPIFIVGIPRSGSTLWHNIVTANDRIFRVGEIHFLNPWRKDFSFFLKEKAGDLSNFQNIKKLVDLMFSEEIVSGLTGYFWINDINKCNDPALKQKICEEIHCSEKSIGDFFKIIIDNIVKYNGYDRVCVKFPVYPNYIPEIIRWYPDCRIIHVTRDPRAISVSKTNDPGGTQLLLKKYSWMGLFIKKMMILYSIIQYLWTSRLHIKYKRIENYALFKYEDLLINSEKVIKDLCAFSHIEFVSDMLAPKEGQSSSLTGVKKRGIDVRAGARWKENISKFDMLFITMLTKGAMKRFGFDPVFYSRSLS